jgi:hypothetical protein
VWARSVCVACPHHRLRHIAHCGGVLYLRRRGIDCGVDGVALVIARRHGHVRMYCINDVVDGLVSSGDVIAAVRMRVPNNAFHSVLQSGNGHHIPATQGTV